MSVWLWSGAGRECGPSRQGRARLCCQGPAGRGVCVSVSAGDRLRAIVTEPISPLMDAAGRNLFATFSWKHESRSVWRTRGLLCQTFTHAGAAEPWGAESQACPKSSPGTELKPGD